MSVCVLFWSDLLLLLKLHCICLVEIVATRCHILRQKGTIIDFGWDSTQTLLQEYITLSHTP